MRTPSRLFRREVQQGMMISTLAMADVAASNTGGVQLMSGSNRNAFSGYGPPTLTDNEKTWDTTS